MVHLDVYLEMTCYYKLNWVDEMDMSEVLYRGRRFSHFKLPGNMYLNLSSKSDQRVENSRNIVGYDTLVP